MTNSVTAVYSDKEFQEISGRVCKSCGQITHALSTTCASCDNCRVCGKVREHTKEDNTAHHEIYDIGQYEHNL